jgi:anti-anti-sigma factor
MKRDQPSVPWDGPGELDPQKLEDLLSCVAYGDQAAFTEFYDQVEGLVHGFARAITGEAASAEEVTTDVLAEIWRTAPRYSLAEGSVQDWVMTMTRRRAVRQAAGNQTPARVVLGDLLQLRQEEPAPAHCGLQVVRPGLAAVVTAPAELDLGTAEQLGVAVLAACASGHDTIVVDMTYTWFCDCTGLGALIRARKRALAHGGDLRLLVPANGIVSRLLALTDLERAVPHFTSLDDALGLGSLADSA